MSDSSPPAKPKPGSLRDRIAAFENKPTAAPGSPAPRPKPAGGVSWKPRASSPPPPSQPGSVSTGVPTPEKKVVGGMNASDAKESIGLGGSLKDRMAALQGRGAFGGLDGGASPPPKPATQKPKWKPPPVVPPADDTEGEIHDSDPVKSPPPPPPPIVQKSSEAELPKADVDDEPTDAPDGEKAAEQLDPEEEERQRRAAIAARMARLGGARLGMAPPVFGKKPSIKKSDPPKDGETQSPESKPTSSPGEPSLKSPPIVATCETSDKAAADGSSDFSGAAPRRSSTSSSLLSVDSASQVSKSPSSMPVPSVPRRAAPPRKKTPKSPSPAPVTHILDGPVEDSPETLTNVKTDAITRSKHELQDDRHEEIGEIDKDVESVPEADKSPAPEKPAPISLDEAVTESPQPQAEEDQAEKETGDDRGTHEPEIYIGEPEETYESPPVSPALDQKDATPLSPVPIAPAAQAGELEKELIEEPDEELTEEKEEAARRKRVAEKLGKMGGINPLAPRPPVASPPAEDEDEREDSTEYETVEQPGTSATSTGLASETARRDSKDSAISNPSVYESPELETPTREESTKSVGSSNVPAPATHEDDLSSRHKEFQADPEEDGREGRTREKQLEEELSFDHDHFATDEDDDREESDDIEENRLAATRAASSVLPTPLVPNISSKPDAKSESQSWTKRSLPPPPRAVPEPPEPEAQQLDTPEFVASRRLSRRSIPPPPVPVDEVAREMPCLTQETKEPHEGEAIPSAPRRSMPPLPRQSGDFTAERAVSPAGSRPQPKQFSSTSSTSPARPERPPAPMVPERPVAPTLAINNKQEFEILDEEQGDPIDPEFHSPKKTPPSSNDSALPPTVSQSVPAPPVPVAEAREVEDDSRRRTIAERMAKLGGIKFGAPPPIGRPPPSASRVETLSPEEPGTPVPEEEPSETPMTDEEEEQARRQRIASKLVGMGGIGMFGAPQRTPPPLPHVRRQGSEGTPAPISSSAPQRAVPPPRPPPTRQPDTDSELESHSTSEDGVKVEAEDSEPEEVQHEDALEQEAPPPIPSRAGRRTSTLVSSVESMASPPRQPTQSPPPLPSGRPRIPSVPINRKSSLRKSSADYVPSSTRMDSFDTSRASPLSATPPSGYVMVDEPENTLSDEAPPRPSQGPPSRPAPPPTKEGVSEWEMPSIPTSFDGPQLDLSLSSWSEDSTSFPGPPAPAPPASSSVPQESKRPSAQAPPKPPMDVQLSPDELMAVWGRIGVQICETATTLFEKSKKLVVGDGSYYGFVNTVFSQVPNAMPPSSSGYGYLIYSQTGSAVSRRVSDILPGDVVELYDAKLKGHKGLQSYHQEVGAGEPLVGVVNEFEAKKSKVKVFHANQHVGQQTVESASYRLEDLKSGVVKIFRVLEA